MVQRSAARVIIRWLALLPAAVLAAWGAWLVVTVLNRITIGMQGINPDSLLGRAYIELISHAVLGTPFVYVGAKVAPTHSRGVALLLAAIGLPVAAYMLYAAAVVGGRWAVWAGLSLIGRLGATAYAVAIGEAGI